MDNEFDEQDHGLELLMPFLPVTSKGGPYDDAAYTAGFEMGRIDAVLSVAKELGLTPDTGYVFHTENSKQIDLIAMKHGFMCEVTDTEDGWSTAVVSTTVPEEDD